MSTRKEVLVKERRALLEPLISRTRVIVTWLHKGKKERIALCTELDISVTYNGLV